MRKAAFVVSMLALSLTLAGCGDGTLKIETKSSNPAPVVVVEKPVIVEPSTNTKETTRTSVTTPDGSTTRTKETKTTTP